MWRELVVVLIRVFEYAKAESPGPAVLRGSRLTVSFGVRADFGGCGGRLRLSLGACLLAYSPAGLLCILMHGGRFVRLCGLTRSQPRRLERSESKVDIRFGGRI